MAGFPGYNIPPPVQIVGAPPVAPQQQMEPQSPLMALGSIQAQIAEGERQRQMAAALMQQGYIPNSGALGSIAQIFSAWAGKKLDKKAGESVADATSREFAAKEEARQAEIARVEQVYQQHQTEARTEAARAAREQRGRYQLQTLGDGSQVWARPPDAVADEALPVDNGVKFTFAPGTSPETIALATSVAQQSGDLKPGMVPSQGLPTPPGTIPFSGPKPIPQSEMEKRVQWLRDHQVPEDQIVQMVMGGQGGVAAVLGDPTKTGDAYIATLDPKDAAQVRALKEGRMQFPSGAALKSPHWQGMLAAVAQYDPEFDAVNYNARSKTRNAFTSGTPSTSINALNTVIGHVGTLVDKAKALNNTRFPVYNSLKNAVATGTGDPQVKGFLTGVEAVASELVRAYRGVGGNEADIQGWKSQLLASNSPEQFNEIIATIAEQLHSKVMSLQQQYKTGMGTTDREGGWFTPTSQKALNDMMIAGNRLPFEDLGGFQQSASAPNASSPPLISTKAEYDALPPGTPYVQPDGSHFTKPGGQ